MLDQFQNYLNSLRDPRQLRWVIILALLVLIFQGLLSWKQRAVKPWYLSIYIPIFCLSAILIFSVLILFGQPEVIFPSGPLASPVSFTQEHPLTIIFNRPISRQLIPRLTPTLEGTWHFDHSAYGPFLPDQLTFIPSKAFAQGTDYMVTLDRILPVAWVDLSHAQKYLFVFSTPPNPPSPSPAAPAPTPNFTPTPPLTHFSLNIPKYKQHYTFTCFSVAAQMVLSYRGVKVDELGFMDEIGYDKTPRNYAAHTWGDPNLGIVGTYNGTGAGGYGVHWDPVAAAIKKYRPVEIKHEASIPEILEAVKAGNPVMVWWVNGVWPAKDLYWKNSQGQSVHAVNGMHVEVVKGWLGDIANPTYILTSDPWRGDRRYTPEAFNQLWHWFNNTAVIVY
jgi:uncharacterized protein YvpB